MRVMSKYGRAAVVVPMLLVTMAVSAAAQGAPAHHPDPLQESIRSARTAADHEAIAREYMRLAALVEADARLHEQRGAAYDDSSLPGVMKEHCVGIAEGYRQQAKKLAALAEAHRRFAKEAPE